MLEYMLICEEHTPVHWEFNFVSCTPGCHTPSLLLLAWFDHLRRSYTPTSELNKCKLLLIRMYAYHTFTDFLLIKCLIFKLISITFFLNHWIFSIRWIGALPLPVSSSISPFPSLVVPRSSPVARHFPGEVARPPGARLPARRNTGVRIPA